MNEVLAGIGKAGKQPNAPADAGGGADRPAEAGAGAGAQAGTTTPQRVLVTGATGFLGRRLVRTLCQQGHRVRVLVRPSSNRQPLAGLAIEVSEGDLTQPRSLAPAVAGQQLVIHAAARVADWGPRSEFWQTNALGTGSLAEACLAQGVERMVLVSSLTVLGLPRDGRLVDEAAPYARPPLDRYSESKIAAERAARAAAERGLALTIVRPGAIWGAGDPTLVPRLERLLRRGLMVQIGDGRNRLGLSHVDNLMQGIVLASFSACAAGQTYHLTDGETITAREVVDGICRALALPAPRRSLPFASLYALAAVAEAAHRVLGRSGPPLVTRYGVRALGSDSRYDISKARRELGYRPAVSFCRGILSLFGEPTTRDNVHT